MSDFFEKGIFLGLGALAMTREKAEKLAGELIDKGKISREEQPEFLHALLTRAEEEKKALEDRLQSMFDSSIERMGLASRQDIQELHAKLDRVIDLLTAMHTTN